MWRVHPANSIPAIFRTQRCASGCDAYSPPWELRFFLLFVVSVNAIPFTYRYPFQSGFVDPSARGSLETATFDPRTLHPNLFRGRVYHPRAFAQMLLLLSKVVRTHFHLHLPPDYLDPVITASGQMLRLEAFSACCGVYARSDLPASAFDGQSLLDGTTNVDFGPQMQSALTRIVDTDDVVWRVGTDDVELLTPSASVIERRVKLPARWIKCFTEVQVIQRRLRPRLELDRENAARLFKLLPKGKSPKKALSISRVGRRVQVSARASRDAVPLSGVQRLAVAEPLVRACDSLRAWCDEFGNTGWEICGPAGRFFLLHSPAPFRAFSGEGQTLMEFATSPWQISEKGFDVVEQADFDRTLPFTLERLERMQTRLKSARRLIGSQHVELVESLGSTHEFRVQSTHTKQYVRIADGEGVCSCRWYARHKNERGPCKHLLAAMIFLTTRDE